MELRNMCPKSSRAPHSTAIISSPPLPLLIHSTLRLPLVPPNQVSKIDPRVLRRLPGTEGPVETVQSADRLSLRGSVPSCRFRVSTETSCGSTPTLQRRYKWVGGGNRGFRSEMTQASQAVGSYVRHVLTPLRGSLSEGMMETRPSSQPGLGLKGAVFLNPSHLALGQMTIGLCLLSLFLGAGGAPPQG